MAAGRGDRRGPPVDSVVLVGEEAAVPLSSLAPVGGGPIVMHLFTG